MNARERRQVLEVADALDALDATDCAAELRRLAHVHAVPRAGRAAEVQRAPSGTPRASRHCWFTRFDWGPCEGRTFRCHLIDKQWLRKEFPHGHGDLTLPELVWDRRVWVSGCDRHHRQFDGPLHWISRADLPPDVEAFAAEFGIEFQLERIYGSKEA